MADIVTMAKAELTERGRADAAALAARAVSGEATDGELVEKQAMIPTWRARDFSGVPVGTPYQWEGMVYKLVQQHDATDNPGWTPDAVSALWAAVWPGASARRPAIVPSTSAAGPPPPYPSIPWTARTP